MVDNADKAIAMTCLRTGAKVKEYTAAPLFMLDKAKGRHQWFIEFDKKPESLDEFATLLDQNLLSFYAVPGRYSTGNLTYATLDGLTVRPRTAQEQAQA